MESGRARSHSARPLSPWRTPALTRCAPALCAHARRGTMAATPPLPAATGIRPPHMVLGTCGRRRCRGGPVAGDALSGEPTPAAYAVAAARPLSSGRGPGRSSRPREPRRSVRAAAFVAEPRAAAAGVDAEAAEDGAPPTPRRAAARPVAVWNHSRHAASAGGGCGIRRLHLVLGAAGTSTCGRPPAAGCRCGGAAAGDVLSGARRSDFAGDCSHSGRARSYSKRAHSHSALSPAPESAARGSPAPESAARTCWRTDAPCPEGQGKAGAAGLRRLA